jgi:hypothetical protein
LSVLDDQDAKAGRVQAIEHHHLARGADDETAAFKTFSPVMRASTWGSA